MENTVHPRPQDEITVGCVGAGVVGRSWLYVFARAGATVQLFDPNPGQALEAIEWLKREVDRDLDARALERDEAAAILPRVRICTDLCEALDGATYVQESGPEDPVLKADLFRALDAAAAPGCLLASSTSSLDMSDIARDVHGAERCLIVHPVNPPHVIPVVEIVGGERTAERSLERAFALMTAVGQRPVRLRSFITGFLLNRLQAALVAEAVHLVNAGVADANTVDLVVSEGLGLRWAILGPFGVANTNADGGLGEYFQRYGPSLRVLMDDLGPSPTFDSEQVARLVESFAATDVPMPSPTVLQNWRNRLVQEIRVIKNASPPSESG